MRRIIPEFTDELAKHFGDPNKIASAKPFKINSFREIVEHTARLSFANKDHLLFFRGQAKDHVNKGGSSTFYPSIYRGDHVVMRELKNKFEVLDGSGDELAILFEKKRIEGFREVKKRKSIQWSILQHYEVCATPLADFTHSLRVACSFATIDNPNNEGLVFVFGMPYITNRISINSEHDIINVRLLSICPPSALRPYFQEGYLAGTEDITTNYDSKTELDFSNRLIAKFVIPNDNSFWVNGFDKIPKKSLYPGDDPIWELCQQIKEIAKTELRPGQTGEFLKSWADLEIALIEKAKKHSSKNLSLRESIFLLAQRQELSEAALSMLERLRKFRNTLVHSPGQTRSEEIQSYMRTLEVAKRELRIKE